MDVDAKSQYEDGENDKENECVDKNGLAICGEAPKLNMAGVSWYLKQKTRRQQYEQHQPK